IAKKARIDRVTATILRRVIVFLPSPEFGSEFLEKFLQSSSIVIARACCKRQDEAVGRTATLGCPLSPCRDFKGQPRVAVLLTNLSQSPNAVQYFITTFWL